jgi:4-hydroxybenzoate polyprenyltransferase
MSRITGYALHVGMMLRNAPSEGSRPAPFGSLRFVAGFLTTMRPYLLFISGVTGLLGMALAPPAPAAATAVLALVFFLAYGFGQALTDCFQTDTDALSSPYRPLVRGDIDRGDVLLTSLGALLLSGVALTRLHPLNLALVGLAVAGLLTYTWMKRRWWGGPPHNAWIVALLVILGFTAASGAAGAPAAPDARMAWGAAAAFFGYAAFVVSGYHKDVEADRATGYRTLPVVWGRRVSAWTSDALSALGAASAAALVLLAPGRPSIAALLGLAAGALAFAAAGVRLHRSHGDDDAHPAIALVVHAYLLTLGAAVVAYRPAWLPALAGGYALFIVTLRLRPVREQI